MRNVKSLIVVLACAGLCVGATEQGPGPILNGQAEGMPGNPVAGAINAIVPSRTSPDVVFVGTAGGGVWKTSNATAASPTWIPLTDRQLPQLWINSLAVSPVNKPSSNPRTLFAGTGNTSSLSGFGSGGIGVARSTDGGTTWTLLARSTFAGRAINSIVPTMLNGGRTVLAATWLDGGGVYESTDYGVKFTRLSGSGTSGLPNAGVTSLIADPSNANRFYAGVPAGAGGGALAGVYRSDNGGLTWTAVNTGLSGLATSLRILLTVHNDAINNVVYADVIATNGTLSGVFRSTNQGGTWTSLGVPSPPIYPGGQGSIHGAIAADPSNPNVVFIAGDSQGGLFPPPPPNANGCSAFSANVFRHTGIAWENAVCNGANGTSPHADSRSMVFDASGNLLQTNDGGIVRLVSPNTAATRRWVPVDGNIRPTQFHSIAYDPLSNIVFGGTQDTGTPSQSSPGSFTWNELLQADGGAVGVDADQGSHAGESFRYSSFQDFARFNRTTWNAANTMLGGMVLVGLNIMSGPGMGMTLFQFDPNIQFYQPFALNAINPSRMLIGTNRIYESMTRGDMLDDLGLIGATVGNGLSGQPMAYGSRLGGLPRPDVFYAGAGNQIFHRVTLGGPIILLGSYPGADVITVAMNPNDYRQVYVCDRNNQVWGSFDEGASWTNLTANLPSLTSQVATIEVFSPDAILNNSVLIAGGFGLFQLRQPGAGGSWTPLNGAGSLIPNALVLDLHYDYTDNILVAGSLGRGSWTVNGPLPALAAVLAASRPASPSRSVMSLPPFRLPPSLASAPPPRAYVPRLGPR